MGTYYVPGTILRIGYRIGTEQNNKTHFTEACLCHGGYIDGKT